MRHCSNNGKLRVSQVIFINSNTITLWNSPTIRWKLLSIYQERSTNIQMQNETCNFTRSLNSKISVETHLCTSSMLPTILSHWCVPFHQDGLFSPSWNLLFFCKSNHPTDIIFCCFIKQFKPFSLKIYILTYIKVFFSSVKMFKL